jgi:hypothetical protein
MHQCGFALWNTTLANYTYGVAQTQFPLDIVSRFVASARKYQLGYGFYYQMGENAWVEACNGMVSDSLVLLACLIRYDISPCVPFFFLFYFLLLRGFRCFPSLLSLRWYRRTLVTLLTAAVLPGAPLPTQ